MNDELLTINDELLGTHAERANYIGFAIGEV